MMDMVVHHSYTDEIDAVDRKRENDEDGSVVDDSDSEDAAKATKIDVKIDAKAMADENSLQVEIEALAMDEETAGRVQNSEDDEGDDEELNSSSASKKASQSNSSQNEIILLSDDEEGSSGGGGGGENDNSGKTAHAVEKDISIDTVLKNYMEGSDAGFHIDPKTKFQDVKYYQVFFEGELYGLKFDGDSCDRVVVQRNTRGSNWPRRGDVLIAINTWCLPVKTDFKHIVTVLKTSLTTPPVRLIFAHDNDFTKIYNENKMRLLKIYRALHPGTISEILPASTPSARPQAPALPLVPAQTSQLAPSASGDGEVIDLLD